ncbi:type III-A CRISPR-associated protein Cas10/Csm1 [Pseudothermotoga sp.]
MDKETLKDVLYLGCLFHDIGKFRQRGSMSEEFRKRVSEEFKYQIENNPRRGLAHEYVGAYVYKNSKLPFKDEVSNLVALHHSDLSNLKSELHLLARLVRIADHISASEREERSQQGSSDEQVKLMRSIISSISLKKQKKPVQYRPVSRFSKFERLLNEEEAKRHDAQKDYEKLWNEFEALISDPDLLGFYRNAENRYMFFERIYHLLKEYTSNIPSAFYYSEPDVSLFSHAVSTAAIALSLFRQFEDRLFEKQNDRFVAAEQIFDKIESILKSYKNPSANPLPEDEPILGIVKGDISGIQSFIFNVSTRRGLKKLRGRSFFIAYLAEIVARYILEKEGLYAANLLFCGGGHFYILLPAKSLSRIEEYQRILDEKLFKAFNTDLSVLLVGKELRLFDMLNFDVHETLGKMLEEKKNRKFSTILNSVFSKPQEMTGPFCPYCGRRMKEVSGVLECNFCESFADLGTQLVNAKYMNLRRSVEIDDARSVHEVFRMFGYKLEFVDEPSEFSFVLNKDEYDPRFSMYFVKTANYVAKEIVQYTERTADLETIAESSKGVKRWAILKGDMDNLGSIFRSITNFEENQRSSLSLVSTLSSEIELFFGVQLERFIAKNHEACNVVYAGGDDFMILGPWNDLIMLAYDIHRFFKDYSKNDELSISMALAIAPSRKYPVYKLGVEAGESLENSAKTYRRNGLEKSALSMFGGCIGWEEFQDFLEKKLLLQKILEEHKVTKNLLHTLSIFVERQLKGEPMKLWQLYYYVARLVERQKDERVKEDILRFFNDVLVSKSRLYDKLDLLLKWVHDETRKVESNAEV